MSKEQEETKLREHGRKKDGMWRVHSLEKKKEVEK